MIRTILFYTALALLSLHGDGHHVDNVETYAPVAQHRRALHQ